MKNEHWSAGTYLVPPPPQDIWNSNVPDRKGYFSSPNFNLINFWQTHHPILIKGGGREGKGRLIPQNIWYPDAPDEEEAVFHHLISQFQSSSKSAEAVPNIKTWLISSQYIEAIFAVLFLRWFEAKWVLIYDLLLDRLGTVIFRN